MAGPDRESPSWRQTLLNRRTLIGAVLLAILVGLIVSNPFWRFMYPIAYQTEIQQAARQAHVDPLLVASIIRTESKFDTDDVSHAGAIGLMQLMPPTAQWVADQMASRGLPINPSVASGQTADLADPAVNIRLGSWYIQYLIAQFDNNQVAAVAAYNAGLTRVKGWLATGEWNGQLNTIMQIPVGETRHFVDRVFYNYTLYQRIYGYDPQWEPTSSG